MTPMDNKPMTDRAKRIFNLVFNHVDNNGDMEDFDKGEIEKDVAAEIKAAVEEEAAKWKQFDKECEVWNLRRIKLAEDAAYKRGVEDEREACAKIADKEAHLYKKNSKRCELFGNSVGASGDAHGAMASETVAELIRARTVEEKR